ncbi:hypothetical protein CF161_12836 [Pseudomonas sp. CF161]|nr:hypothetical protein CF161_12836 [Pseudomonas sp. CF161]
MHDELPAALHTLSESAPTQKVRHQARKLTD